MEYQYKPRIWTNANYIKKEKMMKHSVRKIVYRAVKSGKLKKLPCEFGSCTQVNVEAHHPDYAQPLDVLWLCRPHHLELHKYL